MARTSTYLNFARNTEEAFTFYKLVFGGEFEGGIHRMSEAPTEPDKEPLKEEDKNLVMHVALPITGGHILMGTDAPGSMGFNVVQGNNVHINVEPDTRDEAERLFRLLSSNGKVVTPLQEMFWGDYFGSCMDKFGINWMVNCASKK